MSLKSSGHGGFEGKYRREGESSRFMPWVFFFFFWWLGVKVMVGGSGCGCGHGLSVMSLKSSGHGGFEKLHWVEKDGKTVGERETEGE